MKRVFRALGLLLILSITAVCQPAAKTQVFEAADVHVRPADANEDIGFLPNGRIEARGATMLRLIALAYSVPADRISGGLW